MEQPTLLAQWLANERIAAYIPESLWAQIAVGLLGLALLMLLAGWLTSSVVTTIARRTLVAMGHQDWSVSLSRRRVFRSISYAAPLLVVAGNIGLLPIEEKYLSFIARMFLSVGLVFVFMAVSGALSAWQDVYASSTRAQTRSIKGYLEIGKIVLWAICLISIVSILIDRSPLLMLSGLGALSAVLLLVFKDTLLSLVASTQMTHNDMLRIGDWIEMPQAGADGFVIDIALHTVKVQNWDKTVTTVPTYKLFAESYRNWRYMFESGGRRIKRTLRVDASTIRFLDEDEIIALGRFALLKDYLAGKQHELEESNLALGDLATIQGNRRRLTNIGTFRAYALAYLRQHRELRQDMLMIVRMMEPDSQGVPVEVYCFSDKTAWVEYERIQGDIFDHLLSILPEMSLRLYQAPSGTDLALAWRKGPNSLDAN
ncbi:mechanosensitive ion channel family protein [Allopusillimonas ginsengisoli]|uniref:mechanosensitive ion channel family protein n=1 Tax=Allopusillimonas ginsengisoli TaxID=453575 RepID=UPI00101F2A23|nr:mechanosensitive ion channel family protein [Allopusillimonas ginsengisoli]TEA77692.1 mechanosensitive ion channel family protein [Allopusillimonas ginsengisoli]